LRVRLEGVAILFSEQINSAIGASLLNADKELLSSTSRSRYLENLLTAPHNLPVLGKMKNG
jgi:hypothetical protein